MMMLRSHAWLLIPALLGAGSVAVAPARDGQVSALTLSSSGGTARFAIGVTGPVTVREITYTDPDRLVLDLEGATIGDLGSYDGTARGMVRSVRYRQHAPNIVRVVVEFSQMPAYTLDRGTAGLLTISYTDKDFAKWVAAAGSVPVAVASQDAAPAARTGTDNGSRVTQLGSGGVHLREETKQDDRPITVDFDKTPINEVVRAFAKYSGRSIVIGSGVKGEVTMTIVDQPWPYAFEAVLASQGLSAVEMRGGIIRVDDPSMLAKIDSVEALQIQMVRLNYANAAGVAAAVQGLITKGRGSIVADSFNNALIVTDTRSRIAGVVDFVRGMDVRTPMVAIEGKIIYVDRTDLAQLGLKYDIGTSQQFFNKIVQRCCNPQTGQVYNPNVNVVNLGGNAVSAISNADALITGSALDLVFSTAIGGFSVTSFLSALERVELTDVEATPVVHTLDHQKAEILSGEETPVRVIDASSIGQVGTAPRANVTFKQTGIKLIVTPHVTNNRQIVLDILAERSSIQPLAAADLGFTIPTQRVTTRLLVEDGEMAVSGGMSITTVTRNRAGIPVLSGLPFLGPLFAFSENRENRRDLIFLITPRLLDDVVPQQ